MTGGTARNGRVARRLLVGCAAVVALGVGVVAVRTATVLAVPTDAAIRADHAAVFDPLASPEVRAVRHGGLVCFTAGGDRLVFPPGYWAGPDLALRDDHGRVVAVPGFAVGIAFTGAPVSTPTVCGSGGRALAVVRIEGLGG